MRLKISVSVIIFGLFLPIVGSAQNCPTRESLRASLPTTEREHVYEFGALVFRGEIALWNRPEGLHWVVARGCGGGGGGSTSSFVYSAAGALGTITRRHGGNGGQGAEPRTDLLGPLAKKTYLVVAGTGGAGGPSSTRAQDGRAGCPSEIYELEFTDNGPQLGERLILFPGASGGRASTLENPSQATFDSTRAPRGSDGKRGSGTNPASGGGGGLGPGGRGADFGKPETASIGGDCAGGGGGAFTNGQNFTQGAAGGPGVVTLVPITDIASLLAPTEEPAGATNVPEDPSPAP